MMAAIPRAPSSSRIWLNRREGRDDVVGTVDGSEEVIDGPWAGDAHDIQSV